MFEDDVREVMQPWLNERVARECFETQPLFDTIEKCFPAGLNRIAWEKIRAKRYEEIFPVATGGKATDEIEAGLSGRRESVRTWFQNEAIAMHDEIVWTGDNTNFGLCMTVETLLECFPALFSLPQHSYALPRDGSWCLNYVMEGELFFAKAPESTEGRPSRRRP